MFCEFQATFIFWIFKLFRPLMSFKFGVRCVLGDGNSIFTCFVQIPAIFYFDIFKVWKHKLQARSFLVMFCAISSNFQFFNFFLWLAGCKAWFSQPREKDSLSQLRESMIQLADRILCKQLADDSFCRMASFTVIWK